MKKIIEMIHVGIERIEDKLKKIIANFQNNPGDDGVDILLPENVEMVDVIRGYIVYLNRRYPGQTIQIPVTYGQNFLRLSISGGGFGRINIANGYGPVDSYITLGEELRDSWKLNNATVMIGKSDGSGTYLVGATGELINHEGYDEPSMYIPAISRAAMNWYLENRQFSKH